MLRRSFMHLVGGGTVAATTASLSGCMTDFPAEALAAWQGPGNEPDARRWALAHAILAPSPHNRQPWLADLREANAVSLYVDRKRLLPETDPWFRQIMIGQGTFLEALVLALQARGLAPVVTLFPEGEFKPREVDERPVARVSWLPGAAAPARDPLFAQLLRRCTAKTDYDPTQPVQAATVEALKAAITDPGVHFDASLDAERVARLRMLCWESAQVELRTPRTVMESMRLTRVGPDEITLHRDGISINTLMPRLASVVGAFDREHPPEPGSAAYGQMMSRFEGHSRTAMGFVWLSTSTVHHAAAGTMRSAEVTAGRAYMRLQLRATELGLQMHPMSQAPQEFAEMRTHYDELHRLLLGEPAEEATVQMFCRIGHCAPTQHQPRRGVDAILRA
ncbi:MAG: twin-arginine translocation pathway signal protein [Burkholderiales bacterium]